MGREEKEEGPERWKRRRRGNSEVKDGNFMLSGFFLLYLCYFFLFKLELHEVGKKKEGKKDCFSKQEFFILSGN